MTTTIHVGDPARHRRVVGPIAARRLDGRIGRLPAGTRWVPLADATGSADTVVAVGAACESADVDTAVAHLRDLVAPSGRMLFLEHVGRRGVAGRVQQLVDPVWAGFPLGCHVDHDLPAALRRGGFLVTELERFTMPSVVPLLHRWVHGVAVRT